MCLRMHAMHACAHLNIHANKGIHYFKTTGKQSFTRPYEASCSHKDMHKSMRIRFKLAIASTHHTLVCVYLYACIDTLYAFVYACVRWIYLYCIGTCALAYACLSVLCGVHSIRGESEYVNPS